MKTCLELQKRLHAATPEQHQCMSHDNSGTAELTNPFLV